MIYMLPGFALGKAKKAFADHLPTMASILIYVLSPCMIVSAFLSMDYSRETAVNMALFFVVSFAFQVLVMLGIWLILRKKFHISKYRMLATASTLGNCGFFGMPLIKALLPNNPEVACYSSIYILSMNILVFTFAVYCLTGDRKYISVKTAVLNPVTLSVLGAIPLFMIGARQYIPSQFLDALDLLGRMTTPLCMFIIGIRLSTIKFKVLFTQPFVYLICAGKLVIFPLLAFLTGFFLPVPMSFKASLFILSAVPCASVILSMAEIHGKEQEMSANCILLSTLLCILTIPALSLLLGFL